MYKDNHRQQLHCDIAQLTFVKYSFHLMIEQELDVMPDLIAFRFLVVPSCWSQLCRAEWKMEKFILFINFFLEKSMEIFKSLRKPIKLKNLQRMESGNL